MTLPVHAITYSVPLIVVASLFVVQHWPRARLAFGIGAALFLIVFGIWFTNIDLVRWTTVVTGAMLLLALTAGRGKFAPVNGPDMPLVPATDRPLRHFGEDA